jgi:hypothetical protein
MPSEPTLPFRSRKKTADAMMSVERYQERIDEPEWQIIALDGCRHSYMLRGLSALRKCQYPTTTVLKLDASLRIQRPGLVSLRVGCINPKEPSVIWKDLISKKSRLKRSFSSLQRAL